MRARSTAPYTGILRCILKELMLHNSIFVYHVDRGEDVPNTDGRHKLAARLKERWDPRPIELGGS
jgi:hypothetical protein